MKPDEETMQRALDIGSANAKDAQIRSCHKKITTQIMTVTKGVDESSEKWQKAVAVGKAHRAGYISTDEASEMLEIVQEECADCM